MRPKVVVVALHSQSKKKRCWNCSQEHSSSIFCEHCQSIQDFPLDSLSFFDILGIPEKLLINESELRAKFYELSKQLHPDRFTHAPHPAPQYALRWTTALNRAYQCLKNRNERTQYIIQKHLPKSGAMAKKAVPTDLAESYFEIQDLLNEGQIEPLLKFKAQLEQLLEENISVWESLAESFDTSVDKIATVERLQLQAEKEKYIHSMLADIERKISGV